MAEHAISEMIYILQSTLTGMDLSIESSFKLGCLAATFANEGAKIEREWQASIDEIERDKAERLKAMNEIFGGRNE